MKRIAFALPAGLVAALLAVAAVPGARAGEATAAVAANFNLPLRKLAEQFQRRSGHTLQIVAGSSGGLYAQIKNGAPFDVFFSADDGRTAQMEQEGLGVAGTRFTYALGKLVLWSAKPGVVDDRGQVLVKGNFRRLAMANPKIAPYGAAAQQTLAMLGLWEATAEKRVIGENLGPTYRFIASGNADLGFVALSQVRADPKAAGGSQWIVPENLYNPIKQDAILLRHGQDNAAAQALLAFVRGAEGRELIRGFGYDTP
jgi:molybdate transport system substrate-binding protein